MYILCTTSYLSSIKLIEILIIETVGPPFIKFFMTAVTLDDNERCH